MKNMRTTPWRWIISIWCAGGLFDASQTVLVMHAEGRHHPWPPLFATEFAIWLPWALATPLIIDLARSHPLFRAATLKNLLLHFLVFTVLSLTAESWSALLQVLFNPWNNRNPPLFFDTLTTSLLFQVPIFLIAYALILAVTVAVESRINAARLGEELTKAQLATLRGQIEPHFMFNTLNSIAGLVRHRQNDDAVNMIVGLSEFLRRASGDSHRSQVTLAEEIDYLQRYIDIQRVRFGDRLRISIEVADGLMKAQVPHLLLQPLVENAIKHGISQRVAGGVVRVAGVREKEELHLSIYNDGPNTVSEEQAGNGVGLANLRTRLGILYGEKSALVLKPAPPEGMEVVVTLPFLEE